MKVGVLSLQGAVAEHLLKIKECGHEGIKVKTIKDLEEVERLIIPGGESTTIGKLAQLYGLDKAIVDKCKKGMPVYGTCAGMILLAKNIVNSKQIKFNLMDITVVRNVFGRQVDSFEADLDIAGLKGGIFKAVFIRAPYIKEVARHVKILSLFEDKIVMAQQNNILVTSFHPELSNDIRVHDYFLGQDFNKNDV